MFLTKYVFEINLKFLYYGILEKLVTQINPHKVGAEPLNEEPQRAGEGG